LKDKTDITEYFANLSEQLQEDDLSLIDFDELQKHLKQFSTRREAIDEMAEEYAILHGDYQQRLAGMVKAIAAVDRKRDGYEGALTIIDELPSLSAGDLLRRYRQVSARFRDCFPTSFNGLRTGHQTSLSRSQVRDLK